MEPTLLIAVRMQVSKKLSSCKKNAIVVQPDDRKIAFMNLPLIFGLMMSGYRPIILFTGDECGDAKYFYRTIGMSDFVYIKDQPIALNLQAIKAIHKLENKNDLLNFRHKKIDTGKYALATFIRRYRLGSFNFEDKNQKKIGLRVLFEAIDSSCWATKIVKEIRPEIATFMDRSYLPDGPIFDACINFGSNVITCNASHRNNQVILKSYGVENSRTHPSSISRKNWKNLSMSEWGKSEEILIKEEIEGCYNSGEWYGEVGTQFCANKKTPEEISEILKLDLNKKNVLVFPHIFWDATFFFGKDIYETYEEWFIETMEIAWGDPSVNWIVKIHPANMVKNKRENVNQEYLELDALKKFGAVPNHIKIIYPDSIISTISLLQIGHTCLTIRGTVGVESACYGLNVFTAGTGRYDACGFTNNAETKAEWRSLLTGIASKAAPTLESIALAQKYAYGLFILRPLTLSLINFKFLKDEVATLRIDINKDNALDIFNSCDVIDIHKWIVSSEEDYIDNRYDRNLRVN